MPFAPGSEAGNSIFNKLIGDTYGNEPKHRLAKKILREFEERPSGLHLPSGLVIKRQENDRIKRIAWKIVRGLHYYHSGSLLPESIPVAFGLTPPDQRPPDHFLYVRSLADDETHGIYGGVFDYWYQIENFFLDTDLEKWNYWALLIWDRIIMTLFFHDPWSCQCEECIARNVEQL